MSQEREEEISRTSCHEVIDQLNSKSRAIGDAAWGSLARRQDGKYLVLDALKKHAITRRDGKVRALHLLELEGLGLPEAVEVYASYLQDKSLDVAVEALFGVVYFRKQEYLPAVKELLLRVQGTRHEKYVRRGLAALEQENPQLLCPHFLDQKNVWRLNDVDLT